MLIALQGRPANRECFIATEGNSETVDTWNLPDIFQTSQNVKCYAASDVTFVQWNGTWAVFLSSSNYLRFSLFWVTYIKFLSFQLTARDCQIKLPSKVKCMVRAIARSKHQCRAEQAQMIGTVMRCSCKLESQKTPMNALNAHCGCPLPVIV